jgi:hypothetical protein
VTDEEAQERLMGKRCTLCGYREWLHGGEYKTGSPVCQVFHPPKEGKQ